MHVNYKRFEQICRFIYHHPPNAPKGAIDQGVGSSAETPVSKEDLAKQIDGLQKTLVAYGDSAPWDRLARLQDELAKTYQTTTNDQEVQMARIASDLQTEIDQLESSGILKNRLEMSDLSIDINAFLLKAVPLAYEESSQLDRVLNRYSLSELKQVRDWIMQLRSDGNNDDRLYMVLLYTNDEIKQAEYNYAFAKGKLRGEFSSYQDYAQNVIQREFDSGSMYPLLDIDDLKSSAIRFVEPLSTTKLSPVVNNGLRSMIQREFEEGRTHSMRYVVIAIGHAQDSGIPVDKAKLAKIAQDIIDKMDEGDNKNSAIRDLTSVGVGVK